VERTQGLDGKEDKEPVPLEAGPVSRVERSRCPFCREDVLSTQAVAVCEACLTRHHAPCWSESRTCATCGGGVPLVRGTEQRRRRLLTRLVPLGLLLVVGLGSWTAGARSTATTVAPAEVTAPVARVEPAPPAPRVEPAPPAQPPAPVSAVAPRPARSFDSGVEAETYVLRRTGMVLRGRECFGVRAGTSAETAGLSATFVIESIDEVAVIDAADIAARLARLPEKSVVVIGIRFTGDKAGTLTKQLWLGREPD
jgi:hypothetical protein